VAERSWRALNISRLSVVPNRSPFTLIKPRYLRTWGSSSHRRLLSAGGLPSVARLEPARASRSPARLIAPCAPERRPLRALGDASTSAWRIPGTETEACERASRGVETPQASWMWKSGTARAKRQIRRVPRRCRRCCNRSNRHSLRGRRRCRSSGAKRLPGNPASLLSRLCARTNCGRPGRVTTRQADVVAGAIVGEGRLRGPPARLEVSSCSPGSMSLGSARA
jgi:hypothetical protein